MVEVHYYKGISVFTQLQRNRVRRFNGERRLSDRFEMLAGRVIILKTYKRVTMNLTHKYMS